VDTFYVSANNVGGSLSNKNPSPTPTTTSRRGTKTAKRSTLRRYTSEPTLKEAAEDTEAESPAAAEIVSSGSSAVVTIRGQRKVLPAPTHLLTHLPSLPRARLELNWVYGYRGMDTQRNLWVLTSGELVYYVAAVVVLLDHTHNTQRHYTEHTEDIQCLALHPSRDLVASGQGAGRAREASAQLRVWHTRTLATLHVLGNKQLGVGILAVAFSTKNNGEFLLTVDGEREYLMSVWSWDNEKVLGKVATHQQVLGASFHPFDNNLIVTYGLGHLTLWSRRKDGIFTRSDLLQVSDRNITALEYTPAGDLITGDQNGLLTVWSVDAEGDYYVKKEFKGHKSAISCLQIVSNSTVLSGGVKDRKVIAWDTEDDFEKIVETKLPEQAGGIRSLYPQSPGQHDGNIYVGTTKNMILEGSLQRRFNQVVWGHSNQLWGLAVNHTDGSLTTAGYDKNIIKWKKNHLVWRIQAQSECVSVAVHPQGARVAVGTVDGHLVVINSDSGQHLTTIRICASPLSCLAYNPGGELLAVGSQNGSIYLYRSSKDGFVYTRCGKLTGTQSLSAVDWSTSGRYLQSTSTDYDVIYWSVGELTRIKNALEVRNETWASQTCPLGYLIHGIWSGGKDSSIQVTVDRGPRSDILAAGDSEGYIRIYRYPVLSTSAGHLEYKVYSSCISVLRFSHTDNFMYSAGGTDGALMRWSVT
ncbi:echinoderm microtubule-associated protein-like CG42247, partial [Cherax quadricarinatus]|uniref:echinoderm microtubule-associated protein-like CG42247 n=1 Tax=Cherax quadricarinatus TaxID=27406 RepID=UPI00387E613A